MRNRALTCAAFLVVLAFWVFSGGQKTVDAQAPPAPNQAGQDKFMRLGKYVLNKDQVCYVEEVKQNQVHVHFSGNNPGVILVGEDAKAFLSIITRDDR